MLFMNDWWSGALEKSFNKKQFWFWWIALSSKCNWLNLDAVLHPSGILWNEVGRKQKVEAVTKSFFISKMYILYHLYQILFIVDMNSCRYCAIYRILPFCSQEVNEEVILDKEFCTYHSYLSVSHILTQVIGNSITSCCLNYV